LALLGYIFIHSDNNFTEGRKIVGHGFQCPPYSERSVCPLKDHVPVSPVGEMNGHLTHKGIFKSSLSFFGITLAQAICLMTLLSLGGNWL